MRKFVLRLALSTALLIGGALVYAALDAAADGEPYTVSLNSPASFPADI